MNKMVSYMEDNKIPFCSKGHASLSEVFGIIFEQIQMR